MTKKREPDVAILEYLQQQNRPYSAVDIYNNLHKEFGKTAVEKSLETLSEDGKIDKKTYGKQKVFAPCQSKYGDYNENELKGLDCNIKELQEELTLLSSQVKKKDNELNGLSSQIKTEDAVAAIENLIKENEVLKDRIQKLKTGTVLITKEERKKIFENKEKNVSHWRKRKRMTTDIVDSILEGYPKSKKDLLEEVGMETDEDVGVSFPK